VIPARVVGRGPEAGSFALGEDQEIRTAGPEPSGADNRRADEAEKRNPEVSFPKNLIFSERVSDPGDRLR